MGGFPIRSGPSSLKGEESLVTLGELNRGLPPPRFSQNQSDCRTKTRERDYFVGVFTFTAVLPSKVGKRQMTGVRDGHWS